MKVAERVLLTSALGATLLGPPLGVVIHIATRQDPRPFDHTAYEIGLVGLAGIPLCVPFTLPAGLIGGALALYLIRRHRRPFSAIGGIALGAISGLALGIAGPLACAALLSLLPWAPGVRGLGHLLFLGGASGLVIGALVGFVTLTSGGSTADASAAGGRDPGL